MTRERIILGAAVAICAGLLVAALLVPRKGAPTVGAAGGATAESGGEAESQAPAGPSEATPPATAPSGTAPSAAAAPETMIQETTPPPAASSATPPGQPSFVSEQNRREIVLFFEKSDSEGLGPERRKIFMTASPADQAKQIVVELIGGPRDESLLPTFPPETSLLGLYLDRTGTAYVDLSPEVAALHPGGTSEELATIFSLVDSLTYNLKEIKRVHILIGGEERDTLKDHLDLRRDYLPDMSIVEMDTKR